MATKLNTIVPVVVKSGSAVIVTVGSPNVLVGITKLVSAATSAGLLAKYCIPFTNTDSALVGNVVRTIPVTTPEDKSLLDVVLAKVLAGMVTCVVPSGVAATLLPSPAVGGSFKPKFIAV